MTQVTSYPSIDPPSRVYDEDDYCDCKDEDGAVWGEVCTRPHMNSIEPRYICGACGKCGPWKTNVIYAGDGQYNADLDVWFYPTKEGRWCGDCIGALSLSGEIVQCHECDAWYHSDVDEMAAGVCQDCHEKAVRNG